MVVVVVVGGGGQCPRVSFSGAIPVPKHGFIQSGGSEVVQLGGPWPYHF